MLADDRDRLGWSDIVARIPVILPRGAVEVLLDKLLPPRQAVSSAHLQILWQTVPLFKSRGARNKLLKLSDGVLRILLRFVFASLRDVTRAVVGGDQAPNQAYRGISRILAHDRHSGYQFSSADLVAHIERDSPTARPAPRLPVPAELLRDSTESGG